MTDKLSEKQIKAIALLTAGQRANQVAELVGVTPQTLSRWRCQEDFVNELNRGKRLVMQFAVDKLQASISEVSDQLLRIALEAESEETRRKACTDVIKLLIDEMAPMAKLNELDEELLKLEGEANSYFSYAEALKRRRVACAEIEFYG